MRCVDGVHCTAGGDGRGNYAAERHLARDHAPAEQWSNPKIYACQASCLLGKRAGMSSKGDPIR